MLNIVMKTECTRIHLHYLPPLWLKQHSQSKGFLGPLHPWELLCVHKDRATLGFCFLLVGTYLAV